MIEFQKKIFFQALVEASFCIVIGLFHLLIVIIYFIIATEKVEEVTENVLL